MIAITSRGVDSGVAQHPGHPNERAHILLVGRCIHHDQRSAVAVDPEIAAEARVHGCRSHCVGFDATRPAAPARLKRSKACVGGLSGRGWSRVFHQCGTRRGQNREVPMPIIGAPLRPDLATLSQILAPAGERRAVFSFVLTPVRSAGFLTTSAMPLRKLLRRRTRRRRRAHS